MPISPARLHDGFLFAVLHALKTGQNALQIFTAPTTCCPGRVADGPAACTCWKPVWDLEQADVDPVVVDILNGTADPPVRDGMCADCAYRPNSPEKTGAGTHAGDAAELERLASVGERFYCHDGFRQPVAWRHPAGNRIPADPDHTGDYRPTFIANIPIRANGEPGLLCAGWAARRRALTAKENTDSA